MTNLNPSSICLGTKKGTGIFGLLVLSFLASTSLFADTLYLRSGETVEGRIVGRGANRVEVETNTGTKSFSKADIRSIQYAPFSPGQGAGNPFGKLKKKDAFAEYRPGNFLIELGGSFASMSQTNAQTALLDNSTFLFLGYGNGSTLSQAAYVYSLLFKNDIQTESSAGVLNIEYALADWFSFGMALEHRTLTVSNLASYYTITSELGEPLTLTLFLLNLSNRAFYDSIATTLFLRGDSKSIAVDNLYFDMIFHLPQGRWDPYLKYSLVGGGLNANSYGSGRIATGVRYYFSDSFHASAEAYQALYNVDILGNGVTDRIEVVGAYISFGYRLDTPY